jgi:hypothetical protein
MLLFLALLLIAGMISSEGSVRAEQAQRPLYRVNNNGKWGFIDGSGQLVIPPQWDDATNFSEGLATVWSGGKAAVIDCEGHVVIATGYDDISPFHEGLASVEKNVGKDKDSLWGFINRSGVEVIRPAFEDAGNFSEGRAVVMHAGRWIYIDKKGGQVIRQSWDEDDEPGEFSEGLACVAKNGKYGYIDHTGTYVIKPKYEAAGNFHEGLACVKVQGRWGFINEHDEMVVPARFMAANGFSEGLAAVATMGISMPYGVSYQAWGYIDRTGNMIIAPAYAAAEEFHEGLAAVTIGNGRGAKVGYIDRDGRSAIEAKWLLAFNFEKGLAFVEGKEGEAYVSGYIDRAGNYVWKSSPYGKRLRLTRMSSTDVEVETLPSKTLKESKQRLINARFPAIRPAPSPWCAAGGWSSSPGQAAARGPLLIPPLARWRKPAEAISSAS